MKKILSMLLAFLMFMSLCGCGIEKNDAPAPGTTLNTFYQAIMDAQPEDVEELVFLKNPTLI